MSKTSCMHLECKKTERRHTQTISTGMPEFSLRRHALVKQNAYWQPSGLPREPPVSTQVPSQL